MDDELQSLEAELAQLRPAAPSVDLARRLEQTLARPPARRPLRAWWLGALGLPIAAALVLAVLPSHPSVAPIRRPTSPTVAATPAPPANLLKPVAAENILYAARDEGTVILDDGARARRERLNYIDTITWKNPQTHASLTWSVPREEVRVVPIRYE